MALQSPPPATRRVWHYSIAGVYFVQSCFGGQLNQVLGSPVIPSEQRQCRTVVFFIRTRRLSHTF
jgi:hypothetical protein